MLSQVVRSLFVHRQVLVALGHSLNADNHVSQKDISVSGSYPLLKRGKVIFFLAEYDIKYCFKFQGNLQSYRRDIPLQFV